MSTTSDSSTAPVPHKLVTKSLVAPASCNHCGKFVWGLNQASIFCSGIF